MLRSAVCFLSLYAVYGFVFNTEKPGLCPANDLITTCDCPFPQNSCSNDYECPFDQKCCSFGCGCRTSCESPIYNGQGEGCFQDGQFYQVGQEVPSGDLCNSCTCNVDGTISCTLIGC
ncbi:uncharacterized protein LOC111116684 [Crassostrea virginica]